MKKAITILCTVVTISLVNFYAIAQKQTNKPAAKAGSKQTAKTSGVISKADIEAGKNLIAKSDCLACHKVEETVVGPAYALVAKKYAPNTKNINMLAKKVIEGGAGVWGQIPMNPHPGLAVEDARKMVMYVLSVKSK